MALGTDGIIVGDVPNFIPELWSDEVVASYKSNLVAANLVRKLNHRGKKGDTVKIPTPTRGEAATKALTGNAQVTLIAHGTDTGLTVSIDQHKEYSRFIEDIVDVQALESLRRFYTDDGGYAIAKQVDSALLVEFFNTAAATINYTYSSNTIATTSTFGTIYEGDGTAWDEAGTTDLSDAGIRAHIKILDDGDVPFSERFYVVPTIVKQDLTGLPRFTEEAFVGERAGANTIRNGIVGNVYGVDVYVTTRTPLVEDGLATADNVSAFLFQRDAMLLIEQLGVRSQTQYKQEYLADLFTVDMIYGRKLLREGSVVPIVVPTT